MPPRLHLLAFDSLIPNIRSTFELIPDVRNKELVDYPLADVLLSATAMMFFQDSALLAFQERLKERYRKNNLQTLFGVVKAPKDSQFRRLIDPIDPERIQEANTLAIRKFQRTRDWKKFHSLSGRCAVLIDGTEFFRSENVHCPQCLEFHHKEGGIDFAHQAVEAILVALPQTEVIPLRAEEICRQDGATKQDCEINASKRLLPKLVSDYPHLDFLFIADGLYSKVPMIELVRENRASFLFVAKPTDHPHLEEQLKGLREAEGIATFEEVDDDGRIHRFEFAVDIPLFANHSLTVNWASYTLLNVKGKTGYHNTWVTNILPTKENVKELVSLGRARHKIENEAFNTLKNQGFHLEHNFGHGKKHLSFNLFLLNILAFLLHQYLHLSDRLYREALDARKATYRLWEDIRSAIRFFPWPNWRSLMLFLLDRGVSLRFESG